MIVDYSNDLSTQRFLESEKVLEQLGVLDRPVTEGAYVSLGAIDHPVAAFDGPGIQRLPNGNLISALFHQEGLPLTTLYDGTFNQWHKLRATWPPSIDTLVHLIGQRISPITSKAETALEVACGTGMAGIFALNANPNIKKLHATDINPECVKTTEANKRFIDGTPSCSYQVADGLSGVEGRYDMIIASAIPATPSYPGLKRPLNPLFEGTQLMENILRDSPDHLNKGGRLVISHSSVGEREFQKLAKKYGAKLEQTLATRENAFRVEFLGDSNWVDYLVQNGGMVPRNERGYTHWHTALVKEISF